MRKHVWWVSTALLLVVCTAVAQERGERGRQGGFGFGGPGGFGGPDLVGLLNAEAVQKELELVDDQLQDVRQLAESTRVERPEGNLREMSDEERRRVFEQFQQRRQEQLRQAETKLGEILLPHQLDRLKEIQIQLLGSRALQQPDVAAKLMLTDEQKEKIEQVSRENMEAMREQMRSLFQDGNRDQAREKLAELRQQAETKVLAVLSEPQRDAFAKLKGESFELPEGAFGRGGFGGRGEGNRGGEGGRDGQRRGGQDRPRRPEA